MNSGDRYKITSEDYADIMLEDGITSPNGQPIPGASNLEINGEISIAYIPVENMTLESMNQLGYYSVPGCFGLLSAETNPYRPVNRSVEISNYRGKGVLLGFVDTGIDYLHPAFRYADNTSRIVSLWDQSLYSEDRYPQYFYYGTEFTREEINNALANEDPMSVVPVKDDIGHGTVMAGVACGNINDNIPFKGVAYEAELIVVKLKPPKDYLKKIYLIPDGIPCYQENDIIAGVEYIRRVARDLRKPVVFCLGLGNNIADHAGLRIGSRFYARIGEAAGQVFVTAAGNEANRKNHYFNDIPKEVPSDYVELHVGAQNPGFMMQFWGVSPNFYWIDVYMPDGEFLMRIPPNEGQTIREERQNSRVISDSLINIPSHHHQAIVFRLEKPVMGIWTFMVFGAIEDLEKKVHFWLSLHNFLPEDTYFIKPNNYTTIVGPANVLGILTVSNYDSLTGDLDLYSSRGFTASEFPKPDVVAPGVNMTAPYPNNEYVSVTGTSVAAAYAAGVAAAVLQWGIVEGKAPYLNTPHIKRIFEESAIRDKERSYPNESWGYGILNIEGIASFLAAVYSK